MSNHVVKTVEELLLPFMEKNGFELVDIEYVKEGGRRFLRVYADKEGGIDIEDCSRISEYLSEKLDEADPIPEAYFLEVSSPGAERPLKKPEDFVRAVGKYVSLTTYEPVDGLKKFEGTLRSYSEQEAVIAVGGKTYAVPTSKIASARLAVMI